MFIYVSRLILKFNVKNYVAFVFASAFVVAFVFAVSAFGFAFVAAFA